ncbi:transcriptional regulator family: Fungal Specific TF [Aspergillus niger]|nr:transcriptional regulator family: Fungal Specific TF [Aspergillus niger]
MASERKQRILAPAASKDPVPSSSSSHTPQKRVSTACSNCRLRKARVSCPDPRACALNVCEFDSAIFQCSGTAPCDRCRRHDLACFIDRSTDYRRKNNLKRKIDSLEGDRDLLMQVLETLRNGGLRRTHSLLHLIRNNASLEELQLFVENKLENTSTVDSDEIRLSDKTVPKIPRRVFNTKRLADQPIFRVPAIPWTRVTDDDEFVSHLITLYLTWRHPCFPCLDQDLFLRDMKSAKLSSQFCSPFLVNAILADACAYSDYAEAYEVPSDPSTRGAHFYHEAKQCFEQEDGHLTIATVQALAVLSTCACFMGKDRKGWIYQGQLAFAAKELKRTLGSGSFGSIPDAPDIARATDFTLWGLYNLTVASAFAYQKPPLIEKPSRPRPPSNHNGNDLIWQSYPKKSDGLKAHFKCYFNSLSELTTIIHDCMYYYDIRITISELAKAALYGSENQRLKPEEASLSAARQIAGLVEVHRSFWGIDLFSSSHIQWITVSMYTLLGQLDDPLNLDAFVTLSVAAKVASRRWPLAKGALRAIQVTAKKMGVKLPHECVALFTDFEKEIWGPKGRKELSSLYPNFAVLAGFLRKEALELNQFLQEEDDLDDLNLEDGD